MASISELAVSNIFETMMISQAIGLHQFKGGNTGPG